MNYGAARGWPMLVVDDQKLASWTGTRWERAVAPWCSIKFREPLEWNREIWLLAETDAGTALLAPVVPSELTRPLP